MDIPAQSAPVSKEKWPHSLIIRTTLYDLISAINAEVSADDEDLAIAAVVHLLNTHRLTYIRPSKLRRSVADRRQRPRHYRRTSVSAARGERAADPAHRVCPARPWSSDGPSMADQRPPANT